MSDFTAMSINLHPATVHFPIAFLLLASSAGLLYLYWQPKETLRTLTWWPMLLGWVGVMVAILSGLWAQSPLPPQAPYRSLLNWHISTGLALWVIYGYLLYQRWIYGKARARAKTPQPTDPLLAPAARLWLTVLFVLGIGLVLITGRNGGLLVYTWGVNVLTAP